MGPTYPRVQYPKSHASITQHGDRYRTWGLSYDNTYFIPGTWYLISVGIIGSIPFDQGRHPDKQGIRVVRIWR